MDVSEKLVELIESARYWGSNTSEEIADYLITSNVTVQEWISVKDMLPDRTGSYIVCTDKGAVCTAKFYSDLPTSLRYEKPHWNSSRLNEHITHWMPMPNPPKGE